MNDTVYIYGKFIKETPNRFLCTVLVNNDTVECYIPSSCRLSNFLTLEGQTVILTPNNNPKARTRYSVYAVKVGRQFILAKGMQTGIAMTTNYVRLEKKHAAGTFLKVDFAMYLMLTEAERGVPVLFLESDLVKKVWRFIELLQSYEEIDEDVVTVNLLDIQNKKRIDVTIDREDKKYTSIKSYRMEEG